MPDSTPLCARFRVGMYLHLDPECLRDGIDILNKMRRIEKGLFNLKAVVKIIHRQVL